MCCSAGSTDGGSALDDAGGLCLFWSWYNIVLLTVACVVCVEQPRYRKDERFTGSEKATLLVDGQARVYPMLDCSLGGMQLAGQAPAPLGSTVAVGLGGAHFEATLVRAGAQPSRCGSTAMTRVKQ